VARLWWFLPVFGLVYCDKDTEERKQEPTEPRVCYVESEGERGTRIL